MNSYFFDQAWIGNQWAPNVRVEVDSGIIKSVSRDIEPDSAEERVGGIVLPGMVNVHSHAFQWEFAGKSEFRTQEHDSFWSWRKQMYQSVLTLGPDEYRASAEQLFRLMIGRGYTSIGEFHYVHRAPDNDPYPETGLLSRMMVQAALSAGMRICIIPVLYQRGGFENQPLTSAQQRFELTDQQLEEVLHALVEQYVSNELVTIGMAFHSLRAVDPAKFGRIVEKFESITGGGPIHIHVAEQEKEVQDSIAATGLRPVELLFESANVDHRWCLIHATHMTDDESDRVAASNAVVGLCPTTEANLGDGFFPAERYLDAGGRMAIGSDSHVCIDPFSELRMLESGRRLLDQRRAVLCTETQSCGELLYRSASQGGAQALGINAGVLQAGALADMIVLDESHPIIKNVEGSQTVDRAVFCQYGNPVKRTMIGGKWIV